MTDKAIEGYNEEKLILVQALANSQGEGIGYTVDIMRRLETIDGAIRALKGDDA